MMGMWLSYLSIAVLVLSLAILASSRRYPNEGLLIAFLTCYLAPYLAGLATLAFAPQSTVAIERWATIGLAADAVRVIGWLFLLRFVMALKPRVMRMENEVRS